MAANNPKITPAEVMSSHDPGALLDLIDDLRSKGIDRYIGLPQLVVCGDQSAGKSSVLEAISGARFPMSEGACTRFATELLLRRGPISNAKVSIRPSEDRSPTEKAKLSEFQRNAVELSKFESLVKDATDAIFEVVGKKKFSNEVLRVEITGPAMQNLTIVDLPGIFGGEDDDQTGDDSTFVDKLVRSYMANPRSIILVIISATSDLALQPALKIAREIDPSGSRILGIVTKVDKLESGSPNESSYRKLLDNQSKTLQHGWHALKNRAFKDSAFDSERRDESEKLFFAKGIWKSIDPSRKGVGSLRPKLGKMQKDQILIELPELLKDVDGGIGECRKILHRLGEPRANLSQQRSYLRLISHEFSALMKAAVDGVYNDDFFGDPFTTEGEARYLRAVIENIRASFSTTMLKRGRAKRIIMDHEKSGKTSSQESPTIRRSQYLNDVAELMRRTRGRELQGTFNPMIISDLFYQQAKPWEGLVNECASDLNRVVRETVRMCIEHVTDEDTARGVFQLIISPAMDLLEQDMMDKARQVLHPHQRGHAITYNHYFTDNIQKAKQAHYRRDMKGKLESFYKNRPDPETSEERQVTISQLLDHLTIRTEKDMTKFACSEAIDGMQAYYKVAMKNLIDDFAKISVERCLVGGLSHILNSTTIDDLSDEDIKSIAAESEISTSERLHTKNKLEALEHASRILRRFSHVRPSGNRDTQTKMAQTTDLAEKKNGVTQEQDNETEGEQEEISDLGDIEERYGKEEEVVSVGDQNGVEEEYVAQPVEEEYVAQSVAEECVAQPVEEGEELEYRYSSPPPPAVPTEYSDFADPTDSVSRKKKKRSLRPVF